MITQKMINISPGRPSKVYVANLSVSPILFNKNMVVLYVAKAPDYTVHSLGEVPFYNQQ